MKNLYDKNSEEIWRHFWIILSGDLELPLGMNLDLSLWRYLEKHFVDPLENRLWMQFGMYYDKKLNES